MFQEVNAGLEKNEEKMERRCTETSEASSCLSGRPSLFDDGRPEKSERLLTAISAGPLQIC